MMSIKRLEAPTLLVALALALAACQGAANAPTEPTMSGRPQLMLSSRPDNQNEWQTWSIDWISVCTGRHYAGTYRIHLHAQLKVDADGIGTVTQHFNVAGGTLTDEDGNRYIFKNVGDFAQITLPSGTYVATVESQFMVVSKGAGPNEFVRLALTISWDGVDLTVESAYVLDCRAG